MKILSNREYESFKQLYIAIGRAQVLSEQAEKAVIRARASRHSTS